MGAQRRGRGTVRQYTSDAGYCLTVLILTWTACMITEGTEVSEQLVQPPVASSVGTASEGSENAAGVTWPTVSERDAKSTLDRPQGRLGEQAAGDDEPEKGETPQKKKQSNTEYFRIPHLKYEYKSHSVLPLPLPQCKLLRDEKKEGCQSFSFNEETEECLWSEETFKFNPGWVYYSKEKQGFYRAVPGLKYQSANGRKVSVGDEKTCQADCDKDIACLGFGFSAHTKTCGLAFDGAKFEPKGWAMYLKPASKTDAEEMLNLAHRRIPELKQKAMVEHRSRHTGEYAEREDKEKAAKEKAKAEKQAKVIAETSVKEVTQKKSDAEKGDKLQAKLAEQKMKESEAKIEKQKEQCKEAIQAEKDADAKWHTCKTSHDDADAAAELGKKGYEEAQAASKKAAVVEKSEKRQLLHSRQPRRKKTNLLSTLMRK